MDSTEGAQKHFLSHIGGIGGIAENSVGEVEHRGDHNADNHQLRPTVGSVR